MGTGGTSMGGYVPRDWPGVPDTRPYRGHVAQFDVDAGRWMASANRWIEDNVRDARRRDSARTCVSLVPLFLCGDIMPDQRLMVQFSHRQMASATEMDRRTVGLAIDALTVHGGPLEMVWRPERQSKRGTAYALTRAGTEKPGDNVPEEVNASGTLSRPSGTLSRPSGTLSRPSGTSEEDAVMYQIDSSSGTQMLGVYAPESGAVWCTSAETDNPPSLSPSSSLLYRREEEDKNVNFTVSSADVENSTGGRDAAARMGARDAAPTIDPGFQAWAAIADMVASGKPLASPMLRRQYREGLPLYRERYGLDRAARQPDTLAGDQEGGAR